MFDESHGKKPMSTFVTFNLILFSSVCIIMLTLDETTMFYYSLYSVTGAKTGVIENWKTRVEPPHSKPASRVSSNSTLPSLTAGSTATTTRSTLSKNVLISESRKIKTEEPSVSQFGGLSDEDEANGDERDAAATSPFKGRNRATSSVS
jgi:hypothetical protein